MLRTLVAAGVSVLFAMPAWAQPQLTLSSDIAMPGAPVVATITAAPGRHVALIGSSTGSGFSYGGVPLAVGPPPDLLFVGVLNSSGQASVPFTPPFAGTTLDRYYVQAVTSTAATFLPPEPSSGRIVRNGDLVTGLSALQLTMPPPGDALQIFGNVLMQSEYFPGQSGGGPEQSLRVRRFSTPTGSDFFSGPTFHFGRMIVGGDGSFNFRVLFSSADVLERTVLNFDDKGIVASIRDGTRGSHFEGFLANGHVQPLFRINSEPDVRLEMGPGGTMPVDVSVGRCGAGCLALEGAELRAPGIAGAAVANQSTVLIDAVTGKLGTVISSARFKEQITGLEHQTGVLALRPVSFYYRPEHDGGAREKQYGLIAEEVAQVMPEMVVRDQAGRPHSVRYHLLAPLLLAEIQRLESDRQHLTRQVAELSRQLERLLDRR